MADEADGSPALKKFKCDNALPNKNNLKENDCVDTAAGINASNSENNASATIGNNNLDAHVVARPSEEVIITKQENGPKRTFECDVGITEYINKLPGIPAILKQRYSDFLVRERNLERKLVELTDLEYKKIESKNETTEKEKCEEMICPVSDEDLAKITDWLAQIEKDEPAKKLTLSADNDKVHRTLVHQFVKEKFKQLDTETTELGDGNKAVQLFIKAKSNNKRQNRPDRSRDETKYCHFVMYKENKDTMSAINQIAEVLHVRSSSFTYAGTKDKRAITVQQVCANRIQAEKLSILNRRLRNISVGSFVYKPTPLKLGDLSGNQFVVVLRDLPIDTTRDTVSKVMDSLSQQGFINYFGMQRFGSGSVPTYEIGKAVLCSNWMQAINLIMTPREGEDQNIAEAKKIWLETSDSKAALRTLQRRSSIEGQIIEGLAKLGENSFYNAFQRISRNARLMYLHSYQSYVWNQIVSKRFQKYGLNLLAGDLVVVDDAAVDEGKPLDLKVPKQQINLTRCQVKQITQEELDSNAYSITDIVMPLPGFDMTYPDNALKELYSQLLAEDGFSLDDMKHKIKDYSLSGAYRYMVVKPEEVSWEIIQYDDNCIPLVQTDLDIIEGKAPPDLGITGKLKALKLEFTLPPSTYATMAIREITKLDSSAHHQTKLNTNSL